MAPQRKEISERQLKVLCRMYASLQDCADFFGVSQDTIQNRTKEFGFEGFSAFRNSSLVTTKLSLKQMLIKRSRTSDKLLIYALNNICKMDKEISDQGPDDKNKSTRVISFQEFCFNAKYPEPYQKQVEMMRFMISGEDSQMILGSRGYGKTDYCTAMGISYEVYCDYMTGNPTSSWLILTKSETRNAAILKECEKALIANGVELEKANSECIRVKGLHGKDGSIEATTIKSGSIRGRHPKRAVMDDPVTPEDIKEAARIAVKTCYDELYKLTKRITIIGQPVHKDDLYQNLRDVIRVLEVPHGTIPELDHDLTAMALAGISEASINSSYRLIVSSENPSPFEKVNYIDHFTKADSVAFIDPSFEGIDYTSMSILKGHFDGVAVKGKCWKKSWDNCLDEIVKELIDCGVKRVCIETNSLGNIPVQLLQAAIPSEYGIIVVGRKTNSNKHSRIMNTGSFAKMIYLAKNSDKIYLDQVKNYEFGVKNDDAPDSLASCLNWIGLVKGKE